MQPVHGRGDCDPPRVEGQLLSGEGGAPRDDAARAALQPALPAGKPSPQELNRCHVHEGFEDATTSVASSCCCSSLRSWSFDLPISASRNDHFDRISKARQILAFGAVPFRDFFDPGYFLTLYSSAAMQAIFGHNLLGEALLTVTFIAAGFTIALVTSRRLAGSWAIACAVRHRRRVDHAAALQLRQGAVLSVGRMDVRALHRSAQSVPARCAWRWSRRSPRCIRYDSGLYLGLASLVALVAVHRRRWFRPQGVAAGRGVQRRRSLIVLLPALFYVPITPAGLGNAAHQIAEYGLREGQRTEILSLPAFRVDRSQPLVALRHPGRHSVFRRTSPTGPVWTSNAGMGCAVARPKRRGRGVTGCPRCHQTTCARCSSIRASRTPGDSFDGDEGARQVRPRLRVLPGIVTLRNAAAWLRVDPARAAAGRADLGRGSWRRRCRDHISRPQPCCAWRPTWLLLRDPLDARIGDVAAAAVPLASWLIACDHSDAAIALAPGVAWRTAQSAAVALCSSPVSRSRRLLRRR